MSDEKDDKVIILIIYIIDFATNEENALHSYDLIITKRILSDMFSKISETHCRVTRASKRQDLYLPD